jgi:large conductance mechanosensitive channel
MSGASRRPSAGGFKAFLTKSNALALAIGVIIGGALGAVVNSLVNDVIMPPIGWALGGVDFSQLQLVLGQNAAGEDVAIRWGLFVNALITFVIVAFVVYLIAQMFIQEAEPDPTKECPFCKEANHVDASKCRACQSAI